MKQIIRLTESDLHNIIKESVMQVLNENPAAGAIAAGARVAGPIIARQGAKALGKQAVKQGAKTMGAQALGQGAKQGAKAGAETAANASKGFDASKLLKDPNFIKSAINYKKDSQEANNDMRDSTIDYAKGMMNNKEGLKGYANKTLDYAKKIGDGASKTAKAGLNFAADNPELVSDVLSSLA